MQKPIEDAIIPGIPVYEPAELTGILRRQEGVDVNRLAATVVQLGHHMAQVLEWVQAQNALESTAAEFADAEEEATTDEVEVEAEEDVSVDLVDDSADVEHVPAAATDDEEVEEEAEPEPQPEPEPRRRRR